MSTTTGTSSNCNGSSASIDVSTEASTNRTVSPVLAEHNNHCTLPAGNHPSSSAHTDEHDYSSAQQQNGAQSEQQSHALPRKEQLCSSASSQQQEQQQNNHTCSHAQQNGHSTDKEAHAHAKQNGHTSTTTATTSSSSLTLTATDAQIAALERKSPLPVADRSNYKTFILTNGVFEVESRYIVTEMIGQGAYGVVMAGFDLATNRKIAIKKVEGVFDHRSLAKRTLRELMIVRALPHENILNIDRVCRPHSREFNSIYMVTELMETDLACVIRSPQELTDDHVQFFIYQVLRGLKYIHSAGVIHRDLKPRNLLVNSNCDLKICDFGLARVDDPTHRDRLQMSNYVATRWYRAPEVLMGSRNYTKAVDMWSVGCILAELIGRKPLFPGRDSFHQLTLIVSVLGTPATATANGSSSSSSSKGASKATAERRNGSLPSSSSSTTVGSDYISALPAKKKVPFSHLFPQASAEACDLLDKLLVFDPSSRLTVEQALAHPYLSVLHCEDDEPVCRNFDVSEHFFEHIKLTKEDLRWLTHREIVDHYAADSFDINSQIAVENAIAAGLAKHVPAAAAAMGIAPAAAAAPAANGVLDNFAAPIADALPKGARGKVRRKSI